MNPLRVAIIGVGGMGNVHARYLSNLDGAVMSAVCDIDSERAKKTGAMYGVRSFNSADELLAARTADAVLVATPHYDHPTIGIKALQTGHHLLVEKPIAVGVKAAQQLIDVARGRPELKFGIMFSQRTIPVHQKLRELIASGELGEITRITWIVTDWFRTCCYYASGGWRGTWAGEGGGVLINQCPHNLDLLQWITGLMPRRITAIGYIGKTHPIEVEDEISAILEYPNGAIGHFTTTTGEAPGTNRLEIAGDRGKIVMEHGRLVFSRMRQSVRALNQNSPERFPVIESWDMEIPVPTAPPYGEHERITRNFLAGIRNNTPLLAPGEEGIRGLEIGNAMLMSAMHQKSIDLPIDPDAFDELVAELAKRYAGRKPTAPQSGDVDLAGSGPSFR